MGVVGQNTADMPSRAQNRRPGQGNEGLDYPYPAGDLQNISANPERRRRRRRVAFGPV